MLVLLFADSIREVRKYSKIDVAKGAGVGTSAEADSLAQMRSYNAQRNLFISGFALLFYLMLKRLVSLVSHSANLEIVSDVAMKVIDVKNQVIMRCTPTLTWLKI